MASISSRTMLLNLQQRPLREKQIAVDAGGKLADVAGAQQQLMANDFGLGGIFAQRGDEKFAPEHSVCNRLIRSRPTEEITIDERTADEWRGSSAEADPGDF